MNIEIEVLIRNLEKYHMTISSDFSTLSDFDFLQQLRSKSADSEWKIAELREIERRDKSILANDPELLRKFQVYENQLTEKLDKVNAEIGADSTALLSLTSNEPMARINSAVWVQSLASSQEALSLLKNNAANIASAMSVAESLGSSISNKALMDSFTRQASEISRVVAQAASISSSKASVEQIQKSFEALDAARRGVEMLSIIPRQLLMNQKAVFELAKVKPLSLVSTDSDNLDVVEVISSDNFEKNAKVSVQSGQDQVIQVVLETISSGIMGFNERSDELINLQKETNLLMRRTNELSATTNFLVERTNSLSKTGGRWTIGIAILTIWLVALTLWLVLK